MAKSSSADQEVEETSRRGALGRARTMPEESIMVHGVPPSAQGPGSVFSKGPGSPFAQGAGAEQPWRRRPASPGWLTTSPPAPSPTPGSTPPSCPGHR
eukprot:scaffold4717_cov109-Isochrysis_galbana.AAC.4